MINRNTLFKTSLIFAILLVFSCKDRMHDEIIEEQQKVQDSINHTMAGKASKIPNDKFEVLRYDGCEYVIYKEQPDNNKALGFMAHKGNCNNPIHHYVSYENP